MKGEINGLRPIQISGMHSNASKVWLLVMDF
jgi:hypothetical protein